MEESISTTLFKTGLISEKDLFLQMFSPEQLLFVFHKKFKDSPAKGIDRVNSTQYFGRSKSDLECASKKLIDKSFRFAPFLEKLKLKGRGKEPRVIGIPVIRDRVILYQLHRYLTLLFPDQLTKSVAAVYVREISTDVSQRNTKEDWVCSTDIKTFYDSIDRQRLLKILRTRITCEEAINLVTRALITPTVPKDTKRSDYTNYKKCEGVPQGLAISNILAAIYMAEVDTAMKRIEELKYYRYVDDVLMYGTKETVNYAFRSLRGRLKVRNLELHGIGSKKTQFTPGSQEFSYLGYVFKLPKITVRDSTKEKYLQSIAKKISDFKHNNSKRLEKFRYLNNERMIEIFFMELNEKITGAISSNKRYGWIAYFNQITDLTLLHKMDAAIVNMLSRVPELQAAIPGKLKKLSRAYHEMKNNPRGGYVRDYDSIVTIGQKLRFLELRGRIDPAIPLTDIQIASRYEHYVQRVLARMHEDEGEFY